MPRPDSLPDPATLAALAVDPGASLPLRGLTVLAVEDSRYAADALRLMCQRSGARLRRAGDVATAETHLRLYRPDVVIVDLGLPDGRGEGLIARLAGTGRRMVVLAVSGDPAGRSAALAAGAAEFLEKPLPSLQAVQAAILRHLPDAPLRAPAQGGAVTPDPLALTEDLRAAQAVLAGEPGAAERAWIEGFLAGIARQTRDGGLAAAARGLRDPGSPTARLSVLLADRIARSAGCGPGSALQGRV